jgi:hypothetical protein
MYLLPHPSRLAVKNGEYLRMTTLCCGWPLYGFRIAAPVVARASRSVCALAASFSA